MALPAALRASRNTDAGLLYDVTEQTMRVHVICCRGSLGGRGRAPSRSSRRQRQPWRKCDRGWRGRRGNSDCREVAQRGSPPNAVLAPKPSRPRHWLFPRIGTSKGSRGAPRTIAARRVEGQSREAFLRTLGFWRGGRERVFLPHAVFNLTPMRRSHGPRFASVLGPRAASSSSVRFWSCPMSPTGLTQTPSKPTGGVSVRRSI